MRDGFEFDGELRAFGVELEVVEVQMGPMTLLLIDQPDEKLAPHLSRQINDAGPQILLSVVACLKDIRLEDRRAEDDFIVVRADEFNPAIVISPARDQERGERLSDSKRSRCQRPQSEVLHHFIARNPKLSDMLAVRVRPPRVDDIAFDGLLLEGIAGGRPIA